MSLNFRVAGEVQEFYEELDQLTADMAQVLIWQTDIQEERTAVKANFVSYEGSSDGTLINIMPITPVIFDESIPFYIYEESQGILFKGKYDSREKKVYKIKADDKVFLKERRKARRLYFQYNDIRVDIKSNGKTYRKCKLLNISDAGYGMKISPELASTLIGGSEVELVGIHSIKLPESVVGKVIHSTPTEEIKNIDNGAFVIGLRFIRPNMLLKKVFAELLKQKS